MKGQAEANEKNPRSDNWRCLMRVIRGFATCIVKVTCTPWGSPNETSRTLELKIVHLQQFRPQPNAAVWPHFGTLLLKSRDYIGSDPYGYSYARSWFGRHSHFRDWFPIFPSIWESGRI